MIAVDGGPLQHSETAMMSAGTEDLLRQLTAELQNFESIAQYLLPSPGDLPRLKGIDIYGSTGALTGTVGGDHIIYVDFKRRFNLPARMDAAVAEGRLDVAAQLEQCARKAGIVLIDVSGHRATDAMLAAMLHQAFLLGAIYELDMFGCVTRRLFENLNTRFHRSSGPHKFVSMIYGEISEDARFRFLSAGQPHPAVFSNANDRLMDVDPVSFPPIGILPSFAGIDQDGYESPLGFAGRYHLNDWSLMGSGDILILHTDGVTEHRRAEENYFPAHMEDVLRRVKHGTARTIHDAIVADLLAFNAPADDFSLVVIKRA
jgi:serine phosphatase RsbU (regulator of sigma subunit)